MCQNSARTLRCSPSRVYLKGEYKEGRGGMGEGRGETREIVECRVGSGERGEGWVRGERGERGDRGDRGERGERGECSAHT
jgi:transcription termination factor Rho